MKKEMKMTNQKGVPGGLRRVLAALMLTMGLAICAGGTFTLQAAAQDNEAVPDAGAETQASRFFTTSQHIDAKAEPSGSAKTLFSYEAGAVICVTGETEDGWCSVFYQGQTGYVNMTDVQDKLTPMEVDVEGLNAEMAAQEETSRLIVEETERYRKEARRSKIWAAVIIILVVGIFAMGILSTVRAEKEKTGAEGEEEGAAQESSGSEQDNTATGKTKEEEEMETEDILDLDRE